MPTGDRETLEACYEAGRTGSFSISERAHTSARSLGHCPADLRHALTNASRCAPADGTSRWTVYGPSLDGTEMVLNVVLTGGMLSVV